MRERDLTQAAEPLVTNTYLKICQGRLRTLR